MRHELRIDQALQKGIQAHKAGKTHEANHYYTTILKAQPKHPDANHNMGVLVVGLGKVKEALPFFETALQSNPKITQFWLSYIDALIKVGRLKDARTVFNLAKQNGAKGNSFNVLKTMLNEPIRTENTTQNKSRSQKTILDTLKLEQAIRLARKMVRDGSLDEAKRIYQDILSKFPKNKKALYGIRRLSEMVRSESIDAQNPSQDEIQNLVNIYSQGQLQSTITEASNLLKRFPHSVILYNIVGAANQGLSNLEEAIEAYKKAIWIKPDYAEAFNNMGNALRDQGKEEEAIEAYKKAISLKPDYAEAYNNMGLALRNQDKLQDSIEVYLKALSINPDYAQAYFNMGSSLKDQGNTEESVKAYKKAISIKGDFPEAFNNIGNVLADQGKEEKAVEAYNTALSMKPDYAEAYNNMGNALKNQGKPEESIKAFIKALSIRPDMTEAYYNMGNALKNVRFQKPNPTAQKLICTILDKKTLVRPSEIASAALSLLKLEPVIQKLLSKKPLEKPRILIHEIVSSLSNVPLLVKLMSVSLITDLDLEKLITGLRSCILSYVSKGSDTPSLWQFQSALALNCFTNEYIYNHSIMDWAVYYF